MAGNLADYTVARADEAAEVDWLEAVVIWRLKQRISEMMRSSSILISEQQQQQQQAQRVVLQDLRVNNTSYVTITNMTWTECRSTELLRAPARHDMQFAITGLCQRRNLDANYSDNFN